MSSFIGAMTRMGMRLRRDKCIRKPESKSCAGNLTPLTPYPYLRSLLVCLPSKPVTTGLNPTRSRASMTSYTCLAKLTSTTLSSQNIATVH